MPSDLDHLFRAIAVGDRALSLKMIAASPELATRATPIGATRADASHFLEAIARHVYAGDTALHIAAAAYDVAIVRALLDAGADCNAINRRRATPLHSASVGAPGSSHWHPDAQSATIALLIDAGADPDAADMDGARPLHRAARTRCGAAVAVLLERGAQVRAVNHSGSTPLHLAVQTTGRGGSGTPDAHAEQAAIIRLLVAHGARSADRDRHGRTVRQATTSERVQQLLRTPSS